MGAMAGGGTTGSGTPWTAQQFSAWKRREKGRLVKLRTTLSENSLVLLSYAELTVQVVEAKGKVSTLLTSIAELEKKAHSPGRSPVPKERRLEHHLAQLDEEIAKRFFTGKYKREKEEVAKHLELAKVDSARYAEQKRLADRAREQLAGQKSLLKEAEQGLSTPVKLQNAAKDLGLAESLGRFDDVIDQRLADLEGDPPPPWAVKAVTAYAEEKAAAAREAEEQAAAAAREVEEQRLAKKKKGAAAARQAAKKVADNRKQLEKDSKELADLQGSEAATLKRIEALERRLERENDRVLAEREFIYTKLWNKKKGVRPGLTQRETYFLDIDRTIFQNRSIANYVYDEVREGTWARDPKHKDWATKGVEFSAKLRTSARKIEELEADIKELIFTPKRIQFLKSSIRKLEKDIATADKANAAAGGWPKGKAPRIGYIANAHAFEKYMAEWMRWLGWDDAKAMPVGPDGGIDVKATGALGQAKRWDTEVGIEEVQRHNGVCDGIQKYGRVFLSKSGYTRDAIEWANDLNLPLFEMKAGSKDAGVVASTKAGEKLLTVGAKAMKGNKRN